VRKSLVLRRAPGQPR